MSNFAGKICPFCKAELTENDEIVVCSSCDMPHHKDCWIENQGCTTFGCMGTIKAVDGGPNSVTATEIHYDEPSGVLFCRHCGTRNVGASFCTACGMPLNAPAPQPAYTPPQPPYTAPQPPYTAPQPAYTAPQPPYTAPQPTYTPPQPAYIPPQPQNTYNQGNSYGQQVPYGQSGTVDPDVAAMVGIKQEYYIPKFQEMKRQNKKATWNWIAFFFAPYWFMYRKMYAYGAIALGVSLVVSLCQNFFLSFLSLGGYVTMGILGNYIYMLWLEKRAVQAKAMNEPFKSQFIQTTGGVNSTALILTIVGWVVLSGMISIL